MVSIGELRQIVSEVQTVFPQGLRKTARLRLAEQIKCLPVSEVTNINKDSVKKLTDIFSKETALDYYSKIRAQEQNKIVKIGMKELDGSIKFKNKTANDIGDTTMFGVLKGLFKSETTGLKLPKTIEFKNFHHRKDICDNGEIKWHKPGKIYLNPESDDIFRTTIHEITHDNDLWGRLTSVAYRIPILQLMRLPGSLITNFKANLIEKEISNYASFNREEFVACTAAKLISEGEQWSALDPKIKKLYDMFRGPKLNLD